MVQKDIVLRLPSNWVGLQQWMKAIKLVWTGESEELLARVVKITTLPVVSTQFHSPEKRLWKIPSTYPKL